MHIIRHHLFSICFAVVIGCGFSDAVAEILTQQDIVRLLELKIPEQTIVEKVKGSGTAFVLGNEDIARLKKAGATDALIAAMQSSASTAVAGSEASEVTDLALIVDYSGSMNAKMKDGATKVASAKKCVMDLIDKLPNDLNVSLVVYGTSKARGCDDIDIVQPLGPIDKAALKSKINGFNATGMTPIASSLTKAGEELKKAKGGAAIVLVTDGAESCHGNPAAVAQKLAAEFGVKFGINVIGFGVEPKEKAELADIAAKGHGKLLTANSASELAGALQKVVKLAPTPTPRPIAAVTPSPTPREAVNYQAAGEAVKPGLFFNDAPQVKAGEFKGQLAFKDAFYYKIPVGKGQELRVVAVIQKTALISHLDPSNAAIRQDFIVTIHAPTLGVVAREVAQVIDNPTAPSTVRATWTAPSDGFAYVSIASSANYDSWLREEGDLVNKAPSPSPYTLRLRLDGEAVVVDAPKVISVKAGNNYDAAGLISESGMIVGDLKYGESAFFTINVTKGEVLNLILAAQKPWDAGQHRVYGIPEAAFTILVYDDDQVEVAKKTFSIEGNPPDAKADSLSWPATLSGKAYIVVTLAKGGKKLAGNPPGPGRFALLVDLPHVAVSPSAGAEP